MSTVTSSANQIIVERIFDAPVSLLWQIWTEPEFILQWFGGDPRGTVITAEMDVSIGGKYKVHFADSNGSDHTAWGSFTLVDKHKRLNYSWEWLSEPGKTSEVEVEFISLGDQSKLVLTHKNLHPDSKHRYQQGWTVALDKFQHIVSLERGK